MTYKILIVEDDRGIAQGICTCAANWGMEAHPVEDFRNVMGEFEAVQPHLVLLDISLPFMNGYHWCQEIRRVSSVPVIFLSSASDNMNIIMAMNMGGDDFIPKPFDQSVLIAKMQALLRRTYDFGSAAPVLEMHSRLLPIARQLGIEELLKKYPYEVSGGQKQRAAVYWVTSNVYYSIVSGGREK